MPGGFEVMSYLWFDAMDGTSREPFGNADGESIRQIEELAPAPRADRAGDHRARSGRPKKGAHGAGHAVVRAGLILRRLLRDRRRPGPASSAGAERKPDKAAEQTAPGSPASRTPLAERGGKSFDKAGHRQSEPRRERIACAIIRAIFGSFRPLAFPTLSCGRRAFPLSRGIVRRHAAAGQDGS